MKESKTREKILKKVRHALIQPSLQRQDDFTPVSATNEFISRYSSVITCSDTIDFAGRLLDFCMDHKIMRVFCPDESLHNLLRYFDFPFTQAANSNTDAVLISAKAVIRMPAGILSQNPMAAILEASTARKIIAVGFEKDLYGQFQEAASLWNAKTSNRRAEVSWLPLTPESGSSHSIYIFIISEHSRHEESSMDKDLFFG